MSRSVIPSILARGIVVSIATIVSIAALSAPGFAQPAPEAQGAPVLVDRILGIVDEEAILQSEIDREVALYFLEARNAGQEVDKSEAEVRAEVLDRLVESKLIIAAARQEEIEISDEAIGREVQANIDQLIRYYGSEAALDRALRDEGMNLTDYRKRARGQLRDQHYMRAVIHRFIRPKVEVREEEVDLWYQAHLDEIPATPDSLTLSDILVPVEPDVEVQREVQRKLGAVLQRLGEGVAFADVARDLSEGPAASKGGRLGKVSKGDLFSRVLEDAVFTLGVGESSQPVVTERGIHIVRVDAADGDGRVVSQIFFPLQLGEADVERAHAAAQAIHARLIGGEAFAKVAVETSADPASAPQGGRLGTFAMTDLSETIQAQLADVAAGGLTPPFLTPAGFYIFLVRDRVAGHRFTLDEVRDRVRQAVESEKMEIELASYVTALRSRFVADIKD